MEALPLDVPPNKGWPCTLQQGIDSVARKLYYIGKYDRCHEPSDARQQAYIIMCRYPDTPLWALRRKVMMTGSQKEMNKSSLMYHAIRGGVADQPTLVYDNDLLSDTYFASCIEAQIWKHNQHLFADPKFNEVECARFLEHLLDKFEEKQYRRGPKTARNRELVRAVYNSTTRDHRWGMIAAIAEDNGVTARVLSSLIFRFRESCKEELE